MNIRFWALEENSWLGWCTSRHFILILLVCILRGSPWLKFQCPDINLWAITLMPCDVSGFFDLGNLSSIHPSEMSKDHDKIRDCSSQHTWVWSVVFSIRGIVTILVLYNSNLTSNRHSLEMIEKNVWHGIQSAKDNFVVTNREKYLEIKLGCSLDQLGPCCCFSRKVWDGFHSFAITGGPRFWLNNEWKHDWRNIVRNCVWPPEGNGSVRACWVPSVW